MSRHNVPGAYRTIVRGKSKRDGRATRQVFYANKKVPNESGNKEAVGMPVSVVYDGLPDSRCCYQQSSVPTHQSMGLVIKETRRSRGPPMSTGPPNLAGPAEWRHLLIPVLKVPQALPALKGRPAKSRHARTTHRRQARAKKKKYYIRAGASSVSASFLFFLL